MPWGQRAQGPQQIADGASADGEDGRQGQHEEAEKSRSGKASGQSIKEGACRAGQSLLDVLELAACGLGLERLAAAFVVGAAAAFALETPHAARLAQRGAAFGACGSAGA